MREDVVYVGITNAVAGVRGACISSTCLAHHLSKFGRLPERSRPGTGQRVLYHCVCSRPQGHSRDTPSPTEEAMSSSRFPQGWDAARVHEVLRHYEAQTEEEAVAEDEAAYEPCAHCHGNSGRPRPRRARAHRQANGPASGGRMRTRGIPRVNTCGLAIVVLGVLSCSPAPPPSAGSKPATASAPVSFAAAATRFLESLSPDQRQRAMFPFESEERTHWHFIPTELFPRNGLTIKQMNQSQRTLAHELLQVSL